nr:radical SAM protein [Candidatus Prometheoarchaeum syntrophicum]QEE16231.1 biotin synthase [Candidatus Prometheoarchaeum syntrophicum]
MVNKIQKIRISIGSAVVLGLREIKVDTYPSTCYLMTYTTSQCIGKCSFCPQANGTNKKYADNLSRVQWPVFDWKIFLNNLKENQKLNTELRFKRICIQVLNYRGFFDDVLYIIEKIHTIYPDLNISTAIPPISSKKMEKLHNAGLERIGIALDACKPTLFAKIKGPDNHGPYSWKKHWKSMKEALTIFGNGKVTTHFIVGLGETEEEMIKSIHYTIERNILPGIFLFTPIKGTPMALEKRPPIESFRRIQLARFLLLMNLQNMSRFIFKDGDLVELNNFSHKELRALINEELPFLTAGCPDCNRPNYTYRPGDEPSGFPRSLTFEEKEMVYNELRSLVSI